MSKKSNILIVDNDLRFAFWLGQALDAAGYESLPAKSVEDAKTLLAELGVIVDLMIMHCSVPEARAFAEAVSHSQKGKLKTIGLMGHKEKLSKFEPRWDACHYKPNFPNETAKLDYLELVRDILGESATIPPLLRATVGSHR